MLLHTSRLGLRRFTAADAPAFSAYRSDPAIARYQSWTAPFPLEAATERIRTYNDDPQQPGWFQYAVELTADGCLIGDVGFHLHENLMQGDLGFTLAPGRHGHGYATEAVRAVLHNRFDDGLHRVSAECDARNTRSRRLLERVGFQLEGQRPAFTWAHGEWSDQCLYGLLADQWQRVTP
ncbi:GNAT family N-acetyltransferase [Streptomyces sp. H10-C2]|uniref:GNAT family N-acetyltransferase n=1 Tax=unclassified Streptomyces TaxID=2593676 RepID=UPI0024BAFB70|nr:MULTISPECIES: GNAT family N-acetyltransferase [unclassified Streptomyces]MDJ0347563.1 GNAT family N-acetyltransferase [Streptomyces sp. PH10-H1]MDJ0375774.1 GNAT family N-acetyltransferase [Streptomyces sp. H10-C2]